MFGNYYLFNYPSRMMIKVQKAILLLILLTLTSYFSYSKDEKAKVSLSTPHNTIKTHLIFLQENNWFPELAAKSLYGLNPKKENSQQLAIKLKEVMDARQLYVIMDNVPDDANFRDSVSGQSKYILFKSVPNIYVEKISGKWFYSKETVASIEDLYAETFPFATPDMIENLPPFFREKLFNIEVWQIIGIALFFLVSVVIFKLLTWIFGFLLAKIFAKFAKEELFSRYINPVAEPISLVAIIIFWIVFLPMLMLPIKVGYYISMFFNASYPLIITVIAFRLSDLVADIFERFASKTATTVDDHMVPLVRKTLKIIVGVLGIIYFFENIGISITPLLAGVSIGGLAFALAAQDTVKNLFGSLTIFTDQPFEVGDWIVFSGTEGTVEQVGIRSTRVRTFYNSLISIPNGKLADSLIDNMGKREFRRYNTKLTITYDTPPELIDVFVEGLKTIVLNHPKTRKDYFQIHLNGFGASSLEILFYIFFEVADWTEELEARHQIISEILQLAAELNVRFAFPTETHFIEEFPGNGSLTPKYSNNKNEFEAKMRNYFDRRNPQK
jgi:MscS family membrane protein